MRGKISKKIVGGIELVLKSFHIQDLSVQLLREDENFLVRFVANGAEQRELVYGSYTSASTVFNQWVESLCFIIEHNHKF